MFEWNEDEEVRDTIWGVINETEDNLVSYPKGNNHDALCTFSGYKKQRQEQTSANLNITDQKNSGTKNGFPGSSVEINSNYSTNEELSVSRFDMDSWPDLPSLNPTFTNERTHLHSISSKFRSANLEMGTEKMVTEIYETNAVLQNKKSLLKEPCNLCSPDVTKLNSEPDLFVDEHDDKGDSFLNCDWANITDFDDFDRIFRNDDNIFGHEILSNADEILSPSIDADNTTIPMFPIPDVSLDKERTEKDLSTFQVDKQRGRMQLEKDKSDRQKKPHKSQKKIDVKSRNRTSMSDNQQFENIKMQVSLTLPSQPSSSTLCQSIGDEGPRYVEYLPDASQHLLPAFEYPVHDFPMESMLSPAQPEGKQKQAYTAAPRVRPPSKHASNIQPKPILMTPQEKIDKLRRRQQMQAVLAILQQQQQFGQQSASTEISVSQTSSQMNQGHGAACTEIDDETTKWLTSSELNMTLEGDDSPKFSVLIDDSLRENIFFQLHDAIGKLDVGVRLCIRDSLFRLAGNAMQRHNTSDRSSTNNGSRDDEEEERNSLERSSRLPTETGTNAIDRVVAHVLFHWPSETGLRHVKDEVLSSPMLSNPASKQSMAFADVSEYNAEADEIDTQTSM